MLYKNNKGSRLAKKGKIPLNWNLAEAHYGHSFFQNRIFEFNFEPSFSHSYSNLILKLCFRFFIPMRLPTLASNFLFDESDFEAWFLNYHFHSNSNSQLRFQIFIQIKNKSFISESLNDFQFCLIIRIRIRNQEGKLRI